MGSDPRSGVADYDLNDAVVDPTVDGKLLRLGRFHGVARIGAEIDKHLFQAYSVSEDYRLLWAEV